MTGDADVVIRLLGLQPHPEGGHFRETFRDVAGPDGRATAVGVGLLATPVPRPRRDRKPAPRSGRTRMIRNAKASPTTALLARKARVRGSGGIRKGKASGSILCHAMPRALSLRLAFR